MFVRNFILRSSILFLFESWAFYSSALNHHYEKEIQKLRLQFSLVNEIQKNCDYNFRLTAFPKESLERIPLKSIDPLIDVYGHKNFQHIRLDLYSYKDSLSCKEALLYWLDNFGIGDESHHIRIDSPGHYMKATPVFVIRKEKEILVASTYCELETSEWERFKQGFLKIFGENSILNMDVNCGGTKIKWKRKGRSK